MSGQATTSPVRLSGTLPRSPIGVTDAGMAAVLQRGQACERQERYADARALYERALGDGTARTAAHAAHLLRLVARSWLHDAEYDAGIDCVGAALVVAELAGDEAGRGLALNVFAVIEWKRGNLDEATRLYEAARTSARRTGDARLSAMTTSNLGVIAHIRGEETEARVFYESSLSYARAGGQADQAIIALGNLGQLDTQAGRFDVAARHLNEARELSSIIGDRSLLLSIELLLTRLAVRRGDLGAARAAAARTEELLAGMADPQGAGDAAHVFGLVARAAGDLPAAEQHFTASERFAVEREDMILQGENARELADLYRTQGRNRQTLQRLNQAHRLFAQLRARRELADVDRRTAALENDFLDVVRKWGESIESKDMYTQGHCVRVADLACALWLRVQGDDTSLFWFRIGALLHDVGKLMVPAEVLNKPGKLTEEEWALVRGHPAAGVALLADIEFPWDVRPIVESHHERWDGGGYPSGLAGEAIPLTARVLGIADVYDALTSVRSYKRAFTHDEAMAVMRRDAGTQFDPALFATFEAMMEERSRDASAAPHLVLVG